MLDFIGYLIVLIIIWLIFRVPVLWYFKIDENIKLQKKQTILLSKILDQLGYTEDAQEKKESKKKSVTDNIVDNFKDFRK